MYLPSFESLSKVPVIRKGKSGNEEPQVHLIMTLYKVVNTGGEGFRCFVLLIVCALVDHVSSGGVSTPGMNIENLTPTTQTNPLRKKTTIMTIRCISFTKTAVRDI